MIALQKKPKTTKCSDHRTISLTLHTGKVLAKILTGRFKNKIEQHMSKDLFGFQKGRSAREAIGVLRIMSDRCLENIYYCFIDLQKAFDRSNWNTLMGILKSINVDWRDRRLYRK